MGRHAGVEVGAEKTSKAGTVKGLEKEALPSHPCSSSRLSQALNPVPPEAAGQEEAAASEGAAREQARHQLLRSLWGRGGGHLPNLRPQEEVHGGKGEPRRRGGTSQCPFPVTCPNGLKGPI